MPTALFDPTLRDALLTLDDDEVVLVDEQTRREIEADEFVDKLRLTTSKNGLGAVSAFLGHRRARVRARRLAAGNRPRMIMLDRLADDDLRGVRRVVVALSTDELSTTDRVRSELPRRHVISLKNDVHPAVAVAGNLDERLDRLAFGQPVTDRFFIVAVMRTGSYLVSELAADLRLGTPDEHLRDPLIAALAQRDRNDLSIRRWWTSLEQSQRSSTGWFGTKLISHYLQRVLRVLDDEDQGWLTSVLSSAHITTLERRDRVRQAVSAYRAQRTAVYRARSDQDLRTYRKQIPYDREALQDRFDFVSEQTQFVSGLVDSLAPDRRLDLVYEDVTADLDQVLAQLASFAGVQPTAKRGEPRNKKLADADTEAMVERFRFDQSRIGLTDGATQHWR